MNDVKVEVYHNCWLPTSHPTVGNQQLVTFNKKNPTAGYQLLNSPPSTVHYPLGEVTWALWGTLLLVRRWHFAPCCSAAMLCWVDACTWDLQRELVGKNYVCGKRDILNEFLGKMWICSEPLFS